MDLDYRLADPPLRRVGDLADHQLWKKEETNEGDDGARHARGLDPLDLR
jgi:hypothetical protein